jgi:carotenoid cleavage dioxygenase-like enzyme
VHLGFANAFDLPDGRVAFDAVRAPAASVAALGEGARDGAFAMADVDYGREVPRGALWRVEVDPKTGAASQRALGPARDVRGACVAPAARGKPHRFVYAATGSGGAEPSAPAAPSAGLARVDCETGAMSAWLAPSATQFVGEPVFAPRAGAPADAAEDDGYVLALLFDGAADAGGGGAAGASSVLVFDARDVAAGPTARVPLGPTLGTHVPLGGHGFWAPGVAPSTEELANAQTLLKMYERTGQDWNKMDSGYSGLGIGPFLDMITGADRIDGQ